MGKEKERSLSCYWGGGYVARRRGRTNHELVEYECRMVAELRGQLHAFERERVVSGGVELGTLGAKESLIERRL